VYPTLNAFQLQTSTPVPIEIIVKLVDIRKMTKNYEEASIKFILRPKALRRIDNYLQPFGK
jgi:hypothetical protein